MDPIAIDVADDPVRGAVAQICFIHCLTAGLHEVLQRSSSLVKELECDLVVVAKLPQRFDVRFLRLPLDAKNDEGLFVPVR